MKKIFIFLIIINFPLIAQSRFGLRLEPFSTLVNVEKMISGPAGSNTSELLFESNIAFTLSFTIKGTDNLSISLRPGFISGKLFGGIDGGFFWVYDFTRDKYFILGVNTHLNLGTEGSHNSAGSEGVTIPFVAIGSGYKFSEHGLAELQFHYSLNNVQYGFRRELQSSSSYFTYYYYKMPWMIKLSLSYEWEL